MDVKPGRERSGVGKRAGAGALPAEVSGTGRAPGAARASSPAPPIALALILLAGLWGAPVDASGQEDVTRGLRLDDETAEAVRVDGLLREPFWSEAQVIDDFRQEEPLEGEAATERTEVRVAYDGETLYVGVVAYDRNPDGVVARVLQRDRLMETGFGDFDWAGDDGVALLFDPFHDHRNGVVFATNPNGAEFDALVTDEGREINVSWRGVWDVQAARTPDGWTAEFAIPFRSLRYPEGGGGTWGFNVARMIRRKNEQVLWRSWSRDNEGFGKVSRAGHLEGLTDLPAGGLNVDAKPFALAGTRQVLDESGELPAATDFEVGLDLKTELRPGLVLDLTANTDFAQVEVDDEQVNLTRFDLFFPEKRDFFLENAGIFEFGLRGFGGPPPLLLFFSRRIGIGSEGVVPILGGARLTGRAGGQTVGFLNVTTDETSASPRENFAVARIKRDLGERDYVGFMVTDRRQVGGLPGAVLDDLERGDDPDLVNPDNTAVGVDGSYWLSDRLQFQGLAIRTFTQGPGGEDGAYRAALDYTADRAGFFLEQLVIEPELTTRSGFALRTDVRRSQGFFRFSPRPDVLGLRVVDMRLSTMYQARTDGAFQDWQLGLTLLPEWNTGDDMSLGYQAGETRVDRDFLLSDTLPIPAGRYANDRWNWVVGSSPARPLFVVHRGRREKLYGGRLLSLGGSVRWAPDPRITGEVGYTHNDVETPYGAFTADVASLRLNWSFSTDLFADALVQYNSLDDAVTTNLRLNFIHRPGSDLFVVLTEARGDPDDLLRVQDRGLVVKLTWLQRL